MAASDIVIGGQAASRRHCTIERRNARFFLTDHSTNGTFIAPEKQPEAAVRTATVPLGVTATFIAPSGPGPVSSLKKM